MKTTFIYALCEPGTGKIRYVGKANDSKKRYWDHLASSTKMKTHLGNWLRLLLSAGEKPMLEVLDEVPESQWQFWEREYIRVFRALGMELVNTTDGGDAGPLLKGEKHPFFGKPRTDEVKAKIGAKNRGKIPSAETRVKMSVSGRGRAPISEETRAKLAATSTGRIKSRDTVAKLQAAWTPERQAKMSLRVSGKNHHYFGKKRSSETCAKISASLKARALREKS